jgi:hypothetical protein
MEKEKIFSPEDSRIQIAEVIGTLEKTGEIIEAIREEIND